MVGNLVFPERSTDCTSVTKTGKPISLEYDINIHAHNFPSPKPNVQVKPKKIRWKGYINNKWVSYSSTDYFGPGKTLIECTHIEVQNI